MCLRHISEEKIAEEDITVYKHITGGWEGFLSSYQRAKIEFGRTYTSDIHLFVDDNMDVAIDVALHSYKDLEAATVRALLWYELTVECVIPKGSHYYEGRFGGKVAFASDTLIYTKLIKNYRTRNDNEPSDDMKRLVEHQLAINLKSYSYVSV